MRGGWVMAVLLSLGGIVMGEPGVELVSNGKARASIGAPGDGPPRYAAEQLQKYVREMTGAELPIAAQAPPRVIIRVAPGVAKHDGFRLRVENGDVVVESAEPRGCIFGVYALLETLGCRFYGPAPLGIIVPKRSTLSIPESLNLVREPAFPTRFPSSGTPEEQVQWGCNITQVSPKPETAELAKRLGIRQYRWGHIWPDLVQKQFFRDGRKAEPMSYAGHEDWLPADPQGQRRNNGKSLCFSNPQALNGFTDNTVNWLFTNCRNSDYVSLWSADEGSIALCQCQQCKAKGYNATDWYLLTHNEVRKKLTEAGWNNVFGWIVYHGSEQAPSSVDLLDNGRQMDFLYAPRPRGGTANGPFTSDHPASVKYRKNLDDWLAYLEKQKYSGSRTVFEYYFDLVLLGPHTAGRAYLIPKHDVMQEDMRFYHTKGFDGFFDCNPPSGVWWPAPLSRWLYHRLQWEVNLDLAAARADFLEHYYGPVAGPIREAREAIERLMFETPGEGVVNELRGLDAKLGDTEKTSASDPVLSARVKGFRIWAQYCALCKESEFHEKVTHDDEKGLAAESAIRERLTKNKDFLVSNNFMNAGDLAYITGEVVDRHLMHFPKPRIEALRRTLDFDIAASGEYQGAPKEFAFDGDANTHWSAGKHPPAWIEVRFHAPRDVKGVELLVRQGPDGETRHEILVQDAAGERPVKEFSGFTRTGDWLKASFDPPLRDVTRVRILTTASPSWVCWAEIKIN